MTETERTMKLISYLRQRKGYTLRKMEELTGIPNNNISMYENGKRTPTYENIVKMLTALGKHFELVDNKKKKKMI